MTPFLENGPDLVAKRRSLSKHDGGLGSITEKPCAESCENAGSQNEPTHHGDHSRILKFVPSTIAHTRFLITATLLCHLILALVLVTTRLLSPVLARDEAWRLDSISHGESAGNPYRRSALVHLPFMPTPANIVPMPWAEQELHEKKSLLRTHLSTLGRTLVAYSGGVDSAYLAWAMREAVGSNMLAIIADSPSLARTLLADAIAFAKEEGIPLEVISTSELDRPEYARNDGQRCFHCKDELFMAMEELRVARGFDTIAYGVNRDDQGDFRPGQKAATLHHVAAPLLEAGLTKPEIRQLARQAGLRIWDKPASACLSSRIEYGRPVTREALTVVEKGEDAVRALGFRQFRVRHHGEMVRIEIARDELPRALNPAMTDEFTRIFKALGFKFVTLDLEGFRSGSMNSLLPAEQISGRAG